MKPTYFSSAGLPEHRDAMLIVRMREPEALPATAAGVMRAALSAGSARAMRAITEAVNAVDLPGMSVLSQLEKSGLVRRIASLSRRLPGSATERLPEAAGGAFRTLFMAHAGASRRASPRRAAKPDLHAGVMMLTLERDKDVEGLRAALAADPSVESVARVPARYLLAKKSPKKPAKPAAVPPAVTTMWNMEKIRWKEARALPGFREAAGIKVAVLDTGIDDGHPDLKGRIKSYTSQFPDVEGPSGPKDIVGHGTHVAGTIGALINNAVGINGVCQCELHAWKIFNDRAEFFGFDEGYAYVVDAEMYQQALAACVEEEMDVVNLSIGGPGKPDAVEAELFEQLLARGTSVVAAMGNERQDGSPTSYPAAIRGVVAVGATTLDDKVADFSNRGSHIALSAPGKAIWSTLPRYPGQFGFDAAQGAGGKPVEGPAQKRQTDYDAWDGTSMAAPHVAGAAALLLAKKGAMTSEDVRSSLRAAADKVPAMKQAAQHPDFGAGRLNLLKLLK